MFVLFRFIAVSLRPAYGIVGRRRLELLTHFANQIIIKNKNIKKKPTTTALQIHPCFLAPPRASI